jgi:TPR repeat protein
MQKLFQSNYLILAPLYEEGTNSVLRNPKLALEYYEQAAALGNSLACVKAAIYYKYGTIDGIRKDQHKALEFFQKATHSGMWLANAMIAILFLENGQAQNSEYYWNTFFENLSTNLSSGAINESFFADDLISDFGVKYCLATGKKCNT